jgi:hypothetical protein
MIAAVFAVGATEAPDARGEFDKRGCCSHHQGVCGCQSQQTVCCDGSFSPTCGC